MQQGVIIQHVVLTHNGEKLEYWEAWLVEADGSTPYGMTDHIGWGGNQGSASADVSAVFYPCLGVPSSFIPNNPNTVAHSLPSSSQDPNLSSPYSSAPVVRHLPHN